MSLGIFKSILFSIKSTVLLCLFCNSISFSQSKKEQIIIKQFTIDSLKSELNISNKTIIRDKQKTDSIINDLTFYKNQNIVYKDSINSKSDQINYLKKQISNYQIYLDSLINTLPINYKQLSDSNLLSKENYSSILKDFIDNYEPIIETERYKCPNESIITLNGCNDYEVHYTFYLINNIVAKVFVYKIGKVVAEKHYNPIMYLLYFDYFGNTIVFDDHNVTNHNGKSSQVGVLTYYDKNKISGQEFYTEWTDFDSNAHISENYPSNESENIESIIIKHQSLYGLEEYNKIKNQLYKIPNLSTFLKINNIDK